MSFSFDPRALPPPWLLERCPWWLSRHHYTTVKKGPDLGQQWLHIVDDVGWRGDGQQLIERRLGRWQWMA